MSIIWGVFLFIAAIIGAVVTKLLTTEVTGWIGRIPFLILQVAARRVPREQRDGLYQEWEAELVFELQDTTERPITKLFSGIHYATSLIRGSRKVADELGLTRNNYDFTFEGGDSEIILNIDRESKLSDDVDQILDEIDKALEEAPGEFIRSYVQKGGQ